MPLKRVLVVDDDDETRDLLALVVTREGFSAETAWDGRQGLDAVEAAPPDLVILDMMLPGCGGLEVLHALRGGKHRALPVIVVTGRCDDAATMERIRREPNVRELLAKPVPIKILGEALHRLLG